MGAKRKVDIKLYNKISRELKTPKDDKKVMKKYGLGQTTVRAIRNSYDYFHFLEKTSHNKNKKITLNSSQQVLSPADRALVVATWLFILGMAIAFGMFIRWVASKIFGA